MIETPPNFAETPFSFQRAAGLDAFSQSCHPPGASTSGSKGVAVMKRYVIEREIPGVGFFRPDQLKGAAATSNEALAKLAGKCQWVHSYVVDNKTFCIYLAANEAAIHEHAKLSGFPASKITEVKCVIDPATAGS